MNRKELPQKFTKNAKSTPKSGALHKFKEEKGQSESGALMKKLILSQLIRANTFPSKCPFK